MPSDSEFRMLLLELEDDLSNDERKKFVFLLGEDIPRRKRDEPLVEIFNILIDRNKISQDNCTYLLRMFEALKLFTVAYKLAQFEASERSLPVLTSTGRSSQDIPLHRRFRRTSNPRRTSRSQRAHQQRVAATTI